MKPPKKNLDMKLKSVCPLICMLGSLLLAACDNKEPAAGSEIQSGQTEVDAASGTPLTAPVDYLGAVNTANKMANKSLELAQVNKALQEYRILEGRLPETLTELVKEGFLAREPAAPYGMEVHYNPQTGQVAIVPSKPQTDTP